MFQSDWETETNFSLTLGYQQLMWPLGWGNASLAKTEPESERALIGYRWSRDDGARLTTCNQYQGVDSI